MESLSDSDVLALWEGGSSRHPLDQALLLLGQALPEEYYQGLADWPLGRRNEALAAVLAASFGTRLQAWTACARCGEKLEFELDSRVLPGDGPEGAERRHDQIVVRGRTFRLPSSRDLAYAAGEMDPRAATIRLLERCLVGTAAPAEWSDDDLEEIGDRMALADPHAETRLTLLCPACGLEWDDTLDLVAFLWAQVEARARRILLTVHTLATAYGWTEADVLSLSERRRALYLEMVGA
jgi:hypothetical protein